MTAEPTKRDPRVNPKAGDVLAFAPHHMRLAVTRCENRKVFYDLSRHNGHPIYAIPMKCKDSLPGWRKRTANFEVIHAAD